MFSFSIAFCEKINKNCNSCVMVGVVFGTVDHLVNNAGVLQARLFEEFTQFSDIASVMVIKPACVIESLSYFLNSDCY